MPEQPEQNKETPQPFNLADRVARYRNEVERVVHEVGEHPQYEMKRSCSLTKLSEKIEFVKDFPVHRNIEDRGREVPLDWCR